MKEEKRLYIISNRISKEIRQAVAGSFHEACKLLGWYPADCYHANYREDKK